MEVAESSEGEAGVVVATGATPSDPPQMALFTLGREFGLITPPMLEMPMDTLEATIIAEDTVRRMGDTPPAIVILLREVTKVHQTTPAATPPPLLRNTM